MMHSPPGRRLVKRSATMTIGYPVFTPLAAGELTTESLNELAALLEQGHSERLTSLLKMMPRFYRYSLHNVCLMVSQRPAASRVAGFHTWRTVGPTISAQVFAMAGSDDAPLFDGVTYPSRNNCPGEGRRPLRPSREEGEGLR